MPRARARARGSVFVRACVCARARAYGLASVFWFFSVIFPFGFVIDVDFVFQDPVRQIAKLDQFLGYNRGRELYEQIADACSFTKMKSAKNGKMPEEIKKRYFKDDHVGFYRKGETCSDHHVVIIIMYIYHALINALSAHMIHINLNMMFYTHVEHSPTKTIYIKYYISII